MIVDDKEKYMDNYDKFYLHPGGIFISREPYLIHTVLGSCVSVCIWDKYHSVGGMNHYIYSTSKYSERNGKFGDVSIPYLIKSVIDLGGQRPSLKAHIFGGGQNPDLGLAIGKQNVLMAESILRKHGIEVVSKDVYGNFGRKIVFNNHSGEAIVYKVLNIRRGDWYQDDKK